MIAVTTKLAWYVARSSGIVAWATVTASILWGLTLSSRLVRKRGVPAWLLDLHRYLGTLSLVFVLNRDLRELRVEGPRSVKPVGVPGA